MGKKRKKLQGTVQKVIKPLSPNEPKNAQIEVRDADDCIVNSALRTRSRTNMGAKLD